MTVANESPILPARQKWTTKLREKTGARTLEMVDKELCNLRAARDERQKEVLGCVGLEPPPEADIPALRKAAEVANYLADYAAASRESPLFVLPTAAFAVTVFGLMRVIEGGSLGNVVFLLALVLTVYSAHRGLERSQRAASNETVLRGAAGLWQLDADLLTAKAGMARE